MAVLLACLLVVAGVSHFIFPEPYDRIVPGFLPLGARFWTLASGVVEIAIAGLIAFPRTRVLGAYAAAALFVLVFPANVKMAVDSVGRSSAEFWIAFLRLPLQIPLIWWALRVGRRARDSREVASAVARASG